MWWRAYSRHGTWMIMSVTLDSPDYYRYVYGCVSVNGFCQLMTRQRIMGVGPSNAMVRDLTSNRSEPETVVLHYGEEVTKRIGHHPNHTIESANHG
jgi:hypothetical protein